MTIASCSAYSVCENGATHVWIPFSAPVDELVEGIRRLGRAWATFDPSREVAPLF